MLTAYRNLLNFGPLTPYVGAGIGVAYHEMDEVYFTENPFLTNRIKGKGTYAFAWQATAGVDYRISESLVLDVAYRYADLGKASSGRMDNAGFINPRVEIDDITAHEFKIGLRYNFGSRAPAYETFK